MTAWTEEDMRKTWGAEVAFLRHLADDPALNAEQSSLLLHCAKRIENTAHLSPVSSLDLPESARKAVDQAHDNYMRGNIDATTRDWLIDKEKRGAREAVERAAGEGRSHD